MKNMKTGDIMKKDDMMKKLYVGMDIHKKTITGTAMTEDGEIQFRKTIPNTKEAIQCFLSGVPSPQVRIAIEACDLWRSAYKILRELGYHVVLANPLKTRHIAGTKKTDKVDSKTLANLLRTRYLPNSAGLRFLIGSLSLFFRTTYINDLSESTGKILSSLSE